MLRVPSAAGEERRESCVEREESCKKEKSGEVSGTESNGEEEEEKERREEERRGEMVVEARRMLGVGKTGERTEDIELKWPLGAHSSIPLSLP